MNPGETTRGNKSLFFRNRNAIFLSVILFFVIMIIFLIFLYSLDTESGKTVKNKTDIETNSHQRPSSVLANETTLYKCKFIQEEDWGMKIDLEDKVLKHPIPMVIVSHSATPSCNNFEDCKSRVAQIQKYHVSQGSPDIGYNFIIGGDGNIYVGRGWNARNFHRGYHSIGLNFIGNYHRDELSAKMIECAKEILQYGMKTGKLSEDYIIVCHYQTSVRVPTSPGPNACAEVKTWPHYSNETLYKKI